jgi:hypothetical protein
VTYTEVNNTIRSRYDSAVGRPATGPAVPTSYPNKDLSEAARKDKIWVKVTIQFSSNEQVSFGAQNKQFRGYGMAFFQLFSPLDGGDGESLELGDKIVAAFRAQTITGGLRLLSPAMTTVGRTNDNLWQVNVTCPFTSDHFA